jgi:hypothetical protein
VFENKESRKILWQDEKLPFVRPRRRLGDDIEMLAYYNQDITRMELSEPCPMGAFVLAVLNSRFSCRNVS